MYKMFLHIKIVYIVVTYFIEGTERERTRQQGEQREVTFVMMFPITRAFICSKLSKLTCLASNKSLEE